MNKWFPLGIAKGAAFCNRSEERKFLKYNIQHVKHTLIVSPRRYGKTSLAEKVINEMKLPFCKMEFTLASDIYTAQNIISTNIGELLFRLMPAHKKALSLAMKYFAKLNPKLVIDTRFGPRIELKPNLDLPQLSINELLNSTDKAAVDTNKNDV